MVGVITREIISGPHVLFLSHLSSDSSPWLLDTENLVGQFGIPEDGIIGLKQLMLLRQDSEAGVFGFFFHFDVPDEKIDQYTQVHGETDFVKNSIAMETDVSLGRIRYWGFTEPFPVVNNILMRYTDNAMLSIVNVEYYILKGKMDWQTENESLVQDIHKVAVPDRPAGSEFSQAGDVFQIGRREY